MDGSTHDRAGRAGRGAVFLGLLLLGACGEPPRRVALVTRATVDCALPVTISGAGTSTSASAERRPETPANVFVGYATFDVDADSVEVTVTSDCDTHNGVAGPAVCEFDFGPDGTRNIRVFNGDSDTDLEVRCPVREDFVPPE